MSELADRIQWILDEKSWSARELSRRAGLRSETHVGQLLDGQGGKVETLLKIAEATGVDFLWLATGAGIAYPAPGQSIDTTDVYRNRAKAVHAARLLGTFAETDFEEVRATPGFKAEDDPPTEWWFARIERARERRVTGKRQQGEALNPEGVELPAPPRARRKSG